MSDQATQKNRMLVLAPQPIFCVLPLYGDSRTGLRDRSADLWSGQ